MRKTVIIFGSLIFLFACANQKIAKGEQGIIGEVRWVEGNLMPAIGDATQNARSLGVPVRREIYIFNAIKREAAVSSGGSFFKLVRGELVARFQTKPDGRFKAYLHPGKYSIFTMEKGGYFANIFDGENYINPVTVHANSFTEVQILVNYKAYY